MKKCNNFSDCVYFASAFLKVLELIHTIYSSCFHRFMQNTLSELLYSAFLNGSDLYQIMLYKHILQRVSENCAHFLSELRQIYTNFDNIWQKDGKENYTRCTHFPTSPNSRHHTTVLNADVPKCYRTLKVDICNKHSNDLVSTQQTKMWFI